jgi:hypothetical protein
VPLRAIMDRPSHRPVDQPPAPGEIKRLC